jgi:glycosyltransferase involved in cell wall biosynthesis
LKKRIAIWIHGGIGGGFYSQGQPCIQELVTRLSYHCDIDVYSKIPPNDDFVPDGFRIYSLTGKVQWSAFRWGYLILKFLRQYFTNRYTVLYAFWGYPAGLLVVLLSKLLAIKSIIHLQGGDSACIPDLNYGVFCNPLIKKVCIWSYSKVSILICLTEFQKINLLKNGIIRDVIVIPYGPDLDLFKFANSKFEKEMVRFIHIGNHTPIKDQKTLLKSFLKISEKQDCHLKFIGFDALNGELRKYTDELGLAKRVEFIDPVPYRKIADYFAEADVILHTSLYEGQGMTIAEAAASGVLLAGTRVGLLSDLGDTCAILSEAKDSDELADKVLHFLEHKEDMQECIKKSREWVEAHSMRWTVEKIKSIIEIISNE